MSRTFRSPKITIAASGSDTISDLVNNWKENQAELNDTWTIKVLGSGTLTITPIIDGLTTHASFTATNETIHLDIDGVEDWTLAETSTSNAINVFVTGYRSKI